jgi:hypothetical protein
MPDDVNAPQEDSWRSALSESLDKAEATGGSATEATGGKGEGSSSSAIEGDRPNGVGQSGAPDEAAAPQGDRARDATGRFVKQDAKPAESDKQQLPPAAKPASPGQGAAAGATSPPAPAPAFKPPQSWKPTVREKWTALPAEVQAEVDRREREIAKALQESAEASKGAGTWQETVRPYEAQIRAAGGNPQQYVGNLLQTAHALFYGPGHMKPHVLADIIMQAGVPPQELDAALVARMNGQQAPQQRQPAEFKDPRVDQLLQSIQQREAAAAEERAARFSEAPGHEHFEDVADEMVGLIEFWKGQGKPVTDELMERAYRIACQNNEEVSKVISQKQAAQSAANAQASTQRAKAAASTIRSTPGGNSAPASPGDDWRSHLEEAAVKAGW